PGQPRRTTVVCRPSGANDSGRGLLDYRRIRAASARRRTGLLRGKSAKQAARTIAQRLGQVSPSMRGWHRGRHLPKKRQAGALQRHPVAKQAVPVPTRTVFQRVCVVTCNVAATKIRSAQRNTAGYGMFFAASVFSTTWGKKRKAG